MTSFDQITIFWMSPCTYKEKFDILLKYCIRKMIFSRDAPYRLRFWYIVRNVRQPIFASHSFPGRLTAGAEDWRESSGATLLALWRCITTWVSKY